jgi:hypothetical protein
MYVKHTNSWDVITYFKVTEEIDTKTDSPLDIQGICFIMLFYDFMLMKAVERILL